MSIDSFSYPHRELFKKIKQKIIWCFSSYHVMLSNSHSYEKNDVLKNLSEITANALRDLELTKKELQENDLHMKEMNKLANERVEEMSKVNQQLQNKISFVENVTKTIQEKNTKLESDIKIVKTEKERYHKLNENLKVDLGKIIKKEKELSVKQIFLENKIAEQSDNLERTEKIAIIGQFTSRLAHDMRNPLSKLKMSHEILCNNPNLKVLEKIKHQGKIDKSISDMVHIIEDVLEFVRVSELKIKESFLDELIESSISSVDIPPNVKLETSKSNIKILCDSKKLEAVFINLLTNALHAIDNNGYIRIRINENNDHIKINFEDSGIGINQKNESKVFEPMFSTKTHGTGLGLAICKIIIGQHGGNITYKNHPSEFSVHIPKILN